MLFGGIKLQHDEQVVKNNYINELEEKAKQLENILDNNSLDTANTICNNAKKVNDSSKNRLGSIENTKTMIDGFISKSIEIKGITASSYEIADKTLDSTTQSTEHVNRLSERHQANHEIKNGLQTQ